MSKIYTNRTGSECLITIHFINTKALIRAGKSISACWIAKPILSSSWFPINTEQKLSNPSDAHAAREEVPTFILLNDAHFRPRWIPKSSGNPLNTHRIANLSLWTGLDL